MRDGQTGPHRLRLVVPHSTRPPLSPSPHANSFILGTALINNKRVRDGQDGRFLQLNTTQTNGSLAGLSFPAVYTCVVKCAPGPPYTYCSPHSGFPMSAHLSRLQLFQRHLRSLVRVRIWVWDWVHTSPRTLLHALPFFSPPSFHTKSLSPACTSVWWSD